MSTRRWVYVDGVAYEVGKDAVPVPQNTHVTDGILWGDRHYADVKGPNGEDLSTRTKHRTFMKDNGLTTADDFTESWKKQAEKRAEYYTTGKHGAVSREHIERAIHQLTRGK